MSRLPRDPNRRRRIARRLLFIAACVCAAVFVWSVTP